MTELRKRTLLGFDLTSRAVLWGEIARLGDNLAIRERTLAEKQTECSRRQTRTEALEQQAALFATERNAAERRAIDLRAQLTEADRLNDELAGQLADLERKSVDLTEQLAAAKREAADLAAQLAEAELRTKGPAKRRRAPKKPVEVLSAQ